VQGHQFIFKRVIIEPALCKAFQSNTGFV